MQNNSSENFAQYSDSVIPTKWASQHRGFRCIMVKWLVVSFLSFKAGSTCARPLFPKHFKYLTRQNQLMNSSNKWFSSLHICSFVTKIQSCSLTETNGFIFFLLLVHAQYVVQMWRQSHSKAKTSKLWWQCCSIFGLGCHQSFGSFCIIRSNRKWQDRLESYVTGQLAVKQNQQRCVCLSRATFAGKYWTIHQIIGDIISLV